MLDQQGATAVQVRGRADDDFAQGLQAIAAIAQRQHRLVMQCGQMWITVGDVWRIRYRQIEARIAERAPPMTLPEIHDPLRARRVAPCNRQCRSEEPTSELQSLMRNSYAGFCLQKKKNSIDAKTQTSKH